MSFTDLFDMAITYNEKGGDAMSHSKVRHPVTPKALSKTNSEKSKTNEAT